MKGAGRAGIAPLLTDGRFSGGPTAFCIGHVAPEPRRWPIALVRDGDRIVDRRDDHTVRPDGRQPSWSGGAGELKDFEPRYTSGVLASRRLVSGAELGALTRADRVGVATSASCDAVGRTVTRSAPRPRRRMG